jgi:hypothetical protein
VGGVDVQVQVKLSSLHEFTGGATTVTIEATTIRELLRRPVERYPLLRRRVDERHCGPINGEIYRDDRNKPFPEGAEVYLVPWIPGG